MKNALASCALPAILCSCAAPLPSYPLMAPDAAIAIMRARDSAMRTLSSTATVTMKDAGGQSVSFDAALAASWPDYFRLRAWKLGTAAFDLTLTPEGLWVFIPDDARRRAGDQAKFDVTADQVRMVWKLIGPAALENASALASNDLIRATRMLTGDVRAEFDIDPNTLTVRRCRILDSSDQVRQTLELRDYRMFGPRAASAVIWPTRITARGEHGEINIRLGTPDFNSDLPEGAFIPPRRATKQPMAATD